MLFEFFRRALFECTRHCNLALRRISTEAVWLLSQNVNKNPIVRHLLSPECMATLPIYCASNFLWAFSCSIFIDNRPRRQCLFGYLISSSLIKCNLCETASLSTQQWLNEGHTQVNISSHWPSWINFIGNLDLLKWPNRQIYSHIVLLL